VVRVPSDDHLLELGDGPTIGYATWGHPEGTPVFFAHGTPGSRRVLFPSLDDPAWLRACANRRVAALYFV
jgi:pimeloyl-ACP methyl ester carboxylesterase